MAVIGGGPAGASAAREAATRGLTVLLFDHAHPRRKACGGGLPVKGIEAMDVPVEVTERAMETIVYRYRNRVLRVRVNKGRLVRRDVWDHYLFRRAVEAGAQPAYAAGMRVIFLRSGLVLSKDGGLLRTILPFFRWGLGAVLGSGQQIQSWIDIHDQIRAIEFILGNREISGAVNLTSPEPVTNREFSKLLGQTLRRPVMFRAPAGILRTFGGLMIREMVLSSARVEPLVLKNAGFDFHYPRLKDSFDRLFTPERSKA